MPGITETTRFSCLILQPICCNTLFWLKYMKKNGLHRDMYLEKIPWKDLGNSRHPQTMLWEPLLLRIFLAWVYVTFQCACVPCSTTIVLQCRHSNCSTNNEDPWLFKSLSGFPEGGSPTVDVPLPSFSSNSSASEQVWNELWLLPVNCRKGHVFFQERVWSEAWEQTIF